MTRINQTVACIAGILAMGATHAAADVFDFDVAKVHLYTQDSTTPPVAPHTYAFNAFGEMEAGDATVMTVNGEPLIEEFPGEWCLEAPYGSQTALDAAYPAIAYNLHLQGGTLGSRDETLNLSLPAIYPTPAALSPVSYAGIQDADTTQPLLIEWNGVDPSVTYIAFAVYSVTTDDYVIDVDLPVMETSYLIPANTLNPNDTYEIEIVFANVVQTSGMPNPGFGASSNGLAGYASVTIAEFTTDTLSDSGVIDYWFTKVRDYEQITQSPPTTPFEYVVDTAINMAPDDATSTTINGIPMTEEFPGEWGIFTGFPDQASLDAAYPSAIPYTMALSGGTLGSISETIPLLPEHYPVAPALTSASFDEVQSIDTTQNFLVDWIDPGPDTDFVIFAIYDPNNDSCILDMFFPFGEGSFLIPANTMSPDTEYDFEIGFVHGTTFTGSPFPGFGTQAAGLAGYESITSVNITTAPIGCTDVQESGIIKEITYMQGADNTQPISPMLYRFDGFLDTFDGGFVSGNVTNGITTIPFLEDEPGIWELDQTNVEFGSKPAFDATFPSSMSYTIHIEGGTLGTRDQVVTFGADDYPDVPFLTGTSYSDLDGMDPTQEITVNWAIPSPNTTHVFFEIFNIGTDTKPFEAVLDPATNSVTIPADVLESGAMYEMDINLIASPISFADDCPGFGLGSSNITGFVSSTSVFFTPQSAPSCPADLTGDGTLDFFDISAFLTAFSSSDPVADFTGDGTFDFFDISAFLTAFGNGCP